VVQKWLDKADVETFGEMPADVVLKCIAYVEAKLETPAPKEAASAL